MNPNSMIIFSDYCNTEKQNILNVFLKKLPRNLFLQLVLHCITTCIKNII